VAYNIHEFTYSIIIHRRRHIRFANVPRRVHDDRGISIYTCKSQIENHQKSPKRRCKVNVVNHRTGNCINSRRIVRII